jgi:hypothetical protein
MPPQRALKTAKCQPTSNVLAGFFSLQSSTPQWECSPIS